MDWIPAQMHFFELFKEKGLLFCFFFSFVDFSKEMSFSALFPVGSMALIVLKSNITPNHWAAYLNSQIIK